MKLISNRELNCIELEVNEFCGTRFGNKSQLIVNNKIKGSSNYVVSCEICALDSELYGDGFFITAKYDIKCGRLPCGCAKSPKYNFEQWKVRINRAILESNGRIIFEGLSPTTFKNSSSKIPLECVEHGKWYSTSTGDFVTRKGTCPLCRYDYKSNPKNKTFKKVQEDELPTIHKIEGILKDGDILFLGWKGSIYLGRSKTYCIFSCPEHGEWDTTTVTKFLNAGNRCPKCKIKLISKYTRKDDDYHIQDFINTGEFPEGTVFTRKEINGILPDKWTVYCPICDRDFYSKGSNLKLGKVPCECEKRKPDKCYIILLYDYDVCVSVKFGISVDPLNRLSSVKGKTIYSVVLHSVWEFPSGVNVADVESYIISTVVCGIMSQSEMLDGWTETCYPKDIDKIIEIYKSFGGIEIV